MKPLLAVIAVALLAAGCTTQVSVAGSPPVRQGPSHAALVRAAGLAPCPASSAADGTLPDVTLPCLGNGPAVRLAGLTGQPTVVNVWGSWCIPCQQEARYFASAYDADRGRVRFLGVDTEDSVDSALSFAAHVKPAMHYPSVVDQQKKVLLALHFAGPPVTAFVDSAGKIVHVTPGQYSRTAALQHDIATYLHVRT